LKDLDAMMANAPGSARATARLFSNPIKNRTNARQNRIPADNLANRDHSGRQSPTRAGFRHCSAQGNPVTSDARTRGPLMVSLDFMIP